MSRAEMTLHRFAFALTLMALPVAAQTPAPQPAAKPTTSQIQCLPRQQALLKVPEIISSGGRLRATLIAGTEQQRMPSRYPIRLGTRPSQPGDPQTYSACFPEWVRTFRSPDTTTPYPGPTQGYADPMSGPTLRAKVGDVIELRFFNQIDPAKFGLSIDRGDNADCDSTSAGYPGDDTFPNCFHGSTTANIHFHGTHTNPGSTGDNVFLEILSSKRLSGDPGPTEEMVRSSFDQFFQRCEAELAKGSHVEWPVTWSDLPSTWTDKQKELLQRFDQQPNIGKKLSPVNEKQLQKGQWPQYYVGNYPYCFKLPTYPETTAAPHATGGEGSAELQAHAGMAAPDVVEQGGALRMGQAPGTHWYHAHKHGSTTIDLSNGFGGAFIIEGLYDDEINAYFKDFGPQWARTQPVMVINQFGTSPNLKAPGAGQDKGPDFSVNGRINPVLTMKPGEVQMWRIVNSSARAGTQFIGPPAGFSWRQLAQDGVQFHNDNYAKSLNKSFLLAAGNRADLLVQAPSAPCTNKAGCMYSVQVHNTVDSSDLIPATPPSRGPFNIDLLTIKVTGNPVTMTLPDSTPATTFPSDLGDITAAELNGTKTMEFSSTGPTNPPTQNAVHKIDGKQFSGEVGAVVLLNKVEEWKVTNTTTNISHPFHIHINPFQVVEVFAPNVRLDGTIDGAGSVASTSASATVTGSGTRFLTQFHAGDKIMIESDPVATVSSVQSDTSLTLSAPATVTGATRTYKYIPPKYVVTTDDTVPVLAGQCRINPDKPESWKPCDSSATPVHAAWWDVFPIPSGLGATSATGAVTIPGYFKMRSRFVDYPGYFVIHCHILAHEDRGMMTVVEIAPLRSPYSHH
jgi:FtsP/CotA-like multicopper oxidase with cupredoxin domain